MALVDQALHHFDHLGDVFGRARHVVDAGDIQLFQAIDIIGRHALGQFLDRRAQLAARTMSLSSTSVMLTTQVTW